jgi:hypothetical protein
MEAEMRRLPFHVGPGKKVCKTPSQWKKAGCGGVWQWEASNRIIVVPAGMGKK